MTYDNWPGARWWKVDFHAHSPASFDFGAQHGQVAEKKPSFEDWLLSYMRAGVDAIVVTDHNCHEGIDQAREISLGLKESGHADYRELAIFAGVEITTHGGVHLLGVFDVETPGEVINGLLYSCGYTSVRGFSESVTDSTFAAVAKHVVALGGLAIPAHVDSTAGLFDALRGQSLRAMLEDAPIIAMEVTKPGGVRNQLYAQSGFNWAQVLGSDAHYLDDSNCPPDVSDAKYPGSHFTWAKMKTLNLEGLRLALTDAETSIRRSDEVEGDLNQLSHSVISGISISHLRGAGQADTQTYAFGPWLNAVIGGRGTGKSTVVEVARVALSRFSELPEQLRKDFEWFSPHRGNNDQSLWADPSNIEIEYHKDGHPYRIRWSSSDPSNHAVETRNAEGFWTASPGNVSERFPVRIYSQKQIYQIAQDNRALMALIDAAPEVGYSSWRSSHTALVDKYKSLRSEVKSLEALVFREDELRGRRQDVQRKLDQLQELNKSGALLALRDGEAQLAAASVKENQFAVLEPLTVEVLARYTNALSGDHLVFDISGAPDNALTQAFGARRAAVQNSAEALARAVAALGESREAWLTAVRESQLEAALVQLRTTVREQTEVAGGANGGDQNAVSDLVAEVSSIDATLDEIQAAKGSVAASRTEAEITLASIAVSRKALFSQRRAFISAATKGLSDLKIELFEQASTASLDYELRTLLRRESGFAGNFTSLVAALPQPPHQDYLSKLLELKENLGKIVDADEDGTLAAALGLHKRLVDHLRSLSGEGITANIETWFPDDGLRISYRPESSHEFRPVAQGSPGQKTAALLSLILSIGNEPLILDQPEDDLDNQLIYKLVVKTLREIKHKRQVIVVTHNANIVVNGDSEHVLVLGHGNGNGKTQSSGFLQDESLREEICLIMEGGYEAFDARYRRLGVVG